MPLHGFSLRFQRLAFWLSLLALCSALIAPASVLAQEMRGGKWIGLCGSGLAAESDRHASEDGGHCELCAFPALALPPAAAAMLGPAAEAPAARATAPGLPAGPPERAAIRGPPALS
jgi:hypothetical protein